jgi:hypothetical protein
VKSLFSLLVTVYDLVITIPEQIPELFEDILSQLINGAMNSFPWK